MTFMFVPTVIYCPYCGEPNTDEEGAVVNVLGLNTALVMTCKKCKKSACVILYEELS